MVKKQLKYLKSRIYSSIKSREFILILLVIFIGALPRSVEVLSGNYLFGFDQGLFYKSVKSIVVDHKLTLIGMEVGGIGGFFQGPGWYYLLTIPFIFANGNPYGGMVLMLLIGLLAIFFATYFARKMFGFKTGIIIGLLIAISPVIIPQSRFIWPPFPVSLIAVFFLYFLYKVFEKKHMYLPLATFTLGLLYHFEIATSATLTAAFVLFFPLLIYKKLISLKSFILSLITFSSAFVPLILFDIRHEFLNVKGVLRMVMGTHTGEGLNLIILLKNIQMNMGVFQYNFLSTFRLSEYIWQILLLFMIGGSIYFLKDKKNSFAKRFFVLYLLVTPFILFFIFMFYRGGIWSWWILELHIFYIFMFGILVGYFWKIIYIKRAFLILLFIFLISFTFETINFYKVDFNDFGGTAKMKGKLEVIDYVYQDANGKPFGLFTFSPPIYTHPYDYLVWWYGFRKYNYVPTENKDDLFYLLMEPDPHKPWTYKGWLETYIKTGKLIQEKKFDSGFIIQKRYGEKAE